MRIDGTSPIGISLLGYNWERVGKAKRYDHAIAIGFTQLEDTWEHAGKSQY